MKLEKGRVAVTWGKKNTHGEYPVNLWIDGKRHAPATYFATDKTDAADTAKAMLKNAINIYMANPSRKTRAQRVRRIDVTTSRYINRPSQITRKTPRKRLKNRRTRNLATGRKRFFPNPKPQYMTVRGERMEIVNVLPAGTVEVKDKRGRYYRVSGLPRRKKSQRAPTLKACAYLYNQQTGKRIGRIDGYAGLEEIRTLAKKAADEIGAPVLVKMTRNFSYRKNPEPRESLIDAATARAKSFGLSPRRVRNTPFPSDPGAAFDVGPVLLIGYETIRDGRREKYVHEFKQHARPHLAVSHDGRSLFLLGGAYRFTERGIVDRRDS